MLKTHMMMNTGTPPTKSKKYTAGRVGIATISVDNSEALSGRVMALRILV